MEESGNDSYYVGKGNPERETSFKKVHIWCAAGRYELGADNNGEDGYFLTMSEEIKAGSVYAKLQAAVCRDKSGK